MMDYQILALDLDGTLTNSKKEITPQTKEALIRIQENGIKVVLASGRPTTGVLPLAKELQLERFGSYILSFNGGRITDCRSREILYNRLLPKNIAAPLFEIVRHFYVDIVGYSEKAILSGLHTNQYTELESRINGLPVRHIEPFTEHIEADNNKFLITGEPDEIARVKDKLIPHFHGLLNIYCSDPFFLEIMPQNIDKAHSLEKLLSSIGLTTEQMICCGDGYNDITMIQSAGLGVAMANAQPAVKEAADFITLSNDDDGILYVIGTRPQKLFKHLGCVFEELADLEVLWAGFFAFAALDAGGCFSFFFCDGLVVFFAFFVFVLNFVVDAVEDFRDRDLFWASVGAVPACGAGDHFLCVEDLCCRFDCVLFFGCEWLKPGHEA